MKYLIAIRLKSPFGPGEYDEDKREFADDVDVAKILQEYADSIANRGKVAEKIEAFEAAWDEAEWVTAGNLPDDLPFDIDVAAAATYVGAEEDEDGDMFYRYRLYVRGVAYSEGFRIYRR